MLRPEGAASGYCVSCHVAGRTERERPMARIDTVCSGVGGREQARVSRDASRTVVAVSPFLLERMDELVGRVLGCGQVIILEVFAASPNREDTGGCTGKSEVWTLGKQSRTTVAREPSHQRHPPSYSP